ncbi:MAG: PhnD/SsuA/transferrin family substrate-binding protein, partial [Chloroflexi bacterium]|nr:PhnD/SsuA/transferrin family substrate-binding protein [Chloroflexota bacterium]
MLRLGATATNSHMALCRELETIFRRNGIDFDWVLYSGYDAMVDAFLRKEIDLAWNGPLSYLKIRRALKDGCRNLIMRDVDVNFTTQFITHPDSDIESVADLHGKRFAFAARSSVEAGVLAYHYLKELGIVPQRDLAACSFFDQRQPSSLADQQDVIERTERHLDLHEGGPFAFASGDVFLVGVEKRQYRHVLRNGERGHAVASALAARRLDHAATRSCDLRALTQLADRLDQQAGPAHLFQKIGVGKRHPVERTDLDEKA